MKLVDKATQQEVKIGAKITSFRSEDYMLVSMHPPTHAGSTGRIVVRSFPHGKHDEMFFPSVFSLEWKE